MKLLLLAPDFSLADEWDNRAPAVHSVIRDLQFAGLPAPSHALLLSNSRVPVHAPVLAGAQLSHHSSHDEFEVDIDPTHAHANAILIRYFPNWFIEFEPQHGLCPADHSEYCDTVAEIARAWSADLIVISSHERRLRSPKWMDEVMDIAATADCSVRIVHPRHEHPNAALQVLMCVDGSEESVRMVEHVSTRPFPRNTRMHLVTVVGNQDRDLSNTHHMLDYFGSHLHSAFFRIESQIRYGDPVEQILRYAEQHEIDSIFLPPHGLRHDAQSNAALEVARRAETTVEIVRYTS